MNAPQPVMKAIVLAGQRDGEDVLAQYAGATCKAVVEVDGKPMLLRVLSTLISSSSVAAIILSGPSEEKLIDQNEINNLIQSGDISWLPPRAGPSASAYDALCILSPDEKVLLTTADHPFLSVDIVNDFCAWSAEQDADLVIGLANYSLVHDQFPELKKSVWRFSDGEYCGCNLFAFMTPGSREAAIFWRRLESQRKNPFRVIRSLGWFVVVKYFLGTLTLEYALDTFSRKLGLRVRAVILPYADAAVDVDSVSDYRVVQSRFVQRREDANVSR